MRRASVVVRVVLALAILAVGSVVTAPPCLACSCPSRTPAQIVKAADAAFVGTVVGSRPLSDTQTLQTFRVRETYGGVLPARVDLVADIGPGGGSSCALLFSEGAPVAVAVSENDDGTYATSACSYLTVAELRRVGGVAMPPAPAPPSPTPSPSSPGSSGADHANPFAVAGLGLAAGAALIGAWLLVGARRHRRLAEPREHPEERGEREEDGEA